MHWLRSGLSKSRMGSRCLTTVESPQKTSLDFSLMPGFKKYPLVGTLPSIVTDKNFDKQKIHRFWRAAFDKYGPVVALKYPGNSPMVAILSPEDHETVCRSTLKKPVRYGFSSLRKVRREAKDDFFEGKTGILTENYEEWKRVRMPINFPVMDMKRVLTYVERMDAVALDFVERISEFQRDKGQMPDDFLEEIYKWALESVGTVAFNCRFGCLEKDLHPDSLQASLINGVNGVFEKLAETELGIKFWKYLPTGNIRELQRNHDRFNEVIKQAEDYAKQLNEGKTNKGLLAELRKLPSLSDKDVTTFLVDMISGGIDTTSHSLGFTLYLLAKNPKVLQKLQKEVDEVLGDSGRSMTADDLSKMKYLRNVVKESLRVYPIVVGFPRVLVEDVVLSGYLVPKGHNVFCVNMVTCGHEDYFSKPKEFIPERWEKDRPLGPIHPFAALPFAHGTRVCIGKRIAEQEIRTLIARIVHRFDIEYHFEDIDIVTRLVSAPSRPLRLSFKERQDLSQSRTS